MTDLPVGGVTVDLDDTLFPQELWLSGAWRDVADRASALGLDGGRLLPELIRVAALGSDRGGIIDRALVAIDARPDLFVAPLVETFGAHRPHRLVGYPGALEALDRLRSQLPVVVVTDGAPAVQRSKLAALGLSGIPVVLSDELGGRHLRKPDPAPFRAALGLLGTSAAETVHVGDRPAKDVVGARGAGMRCIRVRTGEYAGHECSGTGMPWHESSTFVAAVAHLLTMGGLPREHGRPPARL